MLRIFMKVKMKLLYFFLILHVFVTVAVAAAAATATTPYINEKNLKQFMKEVETLVLHTTEQALKVTTHIYSNLTKTMSPLLQQAILPITTEYIHMVEEILKYPCKYSEKRNLLRHFRYNSIQLERLRLKLQPEYPKFQFHLISNDFYFTGKNVTEFDNLYSKFMLQFQLLSQSLWDTMTKEVLQQQEDLLKILDEIKKEKELTEKDKLYDEFIEMFLFKTEVDTI